jgi:hypothetical protein
VVTEQHGAPELFDVSAEFSGHCSEVDDGGVRRMQAGEPAHVCFDVGQLTAMQKPYPRHAVGQGTLVQHVQPNPLGLV